MRITSSPVGLILVVLWVATWLGPGGVGVGAVEADGGSPTGVAAGVAAQVPVVSAPVPEKQMPASPKSQSKKIMNFASEKSGAVPIEYSDSLKEASRVLIDDRDKYSIAECSDPEKWIVVHLSEDILVKTVVLANYEKYSSLVKEFQVMGSSSHPTEEWLDMGIYEARPSLGEQTFEVTTPLWARYLKFNFLTHHGTEFYCTLSQIKVHGSTVIESFKQEVERSDEEVRQMHDAIHAPTQADEVDQQLHMAAAMDEAKSEHLLQADLQAALEGTLSEMAFEVANGEAVAMAAAEAEAAVPPPATVSAGGASDISLTGSPAESGGRAENSGGDAILDKGASAGGAEPTTLGTSTADADADAGADAKTGIETGNKEAVTSVATATDTSETMKGSGDSSSDSPPVDGLAAADDSSFGDAAGIDKTRVGGLGGGVDASSPVSGKTATHEYASDDVAAAAADAATVDANATAAVTTETDTALSTSKDGSAATATADVAAAAAAVDVAATIAITTATATTTTTTTSDVSGDDATAIDGGSALDEFDTIESDGATASVGAEGHNEDVASAAAAATTAAAYAAATPPATKKVVKDDLTRAEQGDVGEKGTRADADTAADVAAAWHGGVGAESPIPDTVTAPADTSTGSVSGGDVVSNGTAAKVVGESKSNAATSEESVATRAPVAIERTSGTAVSVSAKDIPANANANAAAAAAAAASNSSATAAPASAVVVDTSPLSLRLSVDGADSGVLEQKEGAAMAKSLGEGVPATKPNTSDGSLVVLDTHTPAAQAAQQLSHLAGQMSLMTCAELLKYGDFQAKMNAKLTNMVAREDDAAHNGGRPGGLPPGQESVFRMLMQKIKSLEMKQAIVDLYMQQVSDCYRSVLVEVMASKNKEAAALQVKASFFHDVSAPNLLALLVSVIALMAVLHAMNQLKLSQAAPKKETRPAARGRSKAAKTK